ncbi:prolyl oligopeptidase family serine peptidase [Hyphococcus sp.]|uniref:prolyl oligopeptidase family serine peptidase n=1 Tax=Hyphococcus sp. TaxID=2038636 RepID=UPI003CCBA138
MIRFLFCAAAASLAANSASLAQDDPFLWLEEVESEKALDWVKAQNARSQAELEADPRFDAMLEEALSVLTSQARLPLGEIQNGAVYNFWQDDDHVRGLWRRASVESYRAGEPDWEILIDFDALAAREDRNWVRGATVCLSPAYVHCMVELSDGGKDAGLWREFNTQTKEFVEGGFFIPEAKSGVAWVDSDTLLVGTDWGENSLTSSGYAREVRRVRRGDGLDEAQTVLRVNEDDVAATPVVYRDGGAPYEFVQRGQSFFEREFFLAQDDGNTTKLPLPLNADIQGMLDGRVIFFLREVWNFKEETYPQGAVVAYDLENERAELVMSAADNESIESVGIGKSSIIIQYLDDVSGAAVRLMRDPEQGTWNAAPIPLPENGVVSLVSSGGGTDDALFSFESLTTPDSLYFVDAGKDGEVRKIMDTPPFYDATGVVVEQRFATSADGTKVPYYIMAQDSVLKEGDAPTVQYAYGGFLSATLPVYYSDPSRPQHGALAGLMWVKRGGVLVLSNIRGGSEYGPRWHQAALKENRQRAFNDFIAISEDLIETGVTSPEKLGAIGRSNGGLLMGALLTQRPDLYAALDIGVPLFDMQRYNKLLAGASWMGEYGNPDIPEEWAYISEYSPYQKLEADKNYPKVLFYTSTKDDRVHPGHARKAAAKMDALGYDFFYYENIEGGHGGTANQDQLAYRTALEYAYFATMLMEADQ